MTEINAVQARELARSRPKSLNIIYGLIKEAAMNAEFAVILEYRLHKLMQEEIKKHGFKVEVMEKGTIIRW